MTDETYVIRAADIAAQQGQRKQHFLNPNARVRVLPLGDATGLTGFGIHIMDVPPGRDSTEAHLHHREDEAVYILSGQGVARIGEAWFDVGPGDFIGYRKGGLAHTIRNTGTEVLRCLTVGERHDTDVVDYPDKGKRMFRTTGVPWNVVDMADIADRPVVVPDSED